MTDKTSKEKGFSLLELLVVIAIMGLLTTMVVVNRNTGAKSLALQRSALQLAQDIRIATENSLRAQIFSGCGTTHGYGIHFDEGNATKGCYVLYAECNGNNTYQGPNCDGGGGGPDDGTVGNVEFEAGVQIQSVSPTAKVDLYFIPPDPTVVINGDSSASAATTIVLELISNPSITRTITVNARGVIDISN